MREGGGEGREKGSKNKVSCVKWRELKEKSDDNMRKTKGGVAREKG